MRLCRERQIIPYNIEIQWHDILMGQWKQIFKNFTLNIPFILSINCDLFLFSILQGLHKTLYILNDHRKSINTIRIFKKIVSTSKIELFLLNWICFKIHISEFNMAISNVIIMCSSNLYHSKNELSPVQARHFHRNTEWSHKHWVEKTSH